MLTVHRAERADVLVDALAQVLREPPADPFAVEVVAVPSRGVERWVAQRLSGVLGASRAGAGDGVCALVRFPSPADLVAEVVSVASGLTPDDDPWRRERLVWALLEVVDECVAEPWCAALAAHLGEQSGDVRRGRRLSTAARLARLFEEYAAMRPGLLRDWAEGRDDDGAGGALDPDLVWQAELWRRLRARVGAASPAERLGPACARVRHEPGSVDLPDRLSVLGPTRLPQASLEVLRALAHARDVHLWVPHPSPALWDELCESSVPARRRDDASALAVRLPLLASLGRDARELQLQLRAAGVTASVHHPAPPLPTTLLGRLQRAVRDDAVVEAQPLPPIDRSVSVHACHGPARQVEVLREVLVGLFADDPALEPRDVLVMCPDIEDYAPLVSATFGLLDPSDTELDGAHPGQRLRVRLADRSLRQTNPVLGVVAALLDLADARVTASAVLDLAGRTPVRQRFGFDDDDLELLHEWTAAAGVRWGLDADHRARAQLRTVTQGTWRAGLDRLLLGVAMADEGERWLGLALPLDDVHSSDVDLAGRLAELLDRLSGVLDRMCGTAPVADWVELLTSALDALTDVRPADAWQLAEARRALAGIADDAGPRAAEVRLELADVRALLADGLAGRPTRAGFRTGTLTMCSLVPMRSVPHRVVCLLGLDDGRFPRSAAVDGEDALARDPCLGERDPRSEDRQLLLDALLAATDRVVVLFTGADPRTGARRPPAVPVGELLDTVDALVQSSEGRSGRDAVLVHHPLQPFDPRGFVPGALGRDAPFSFDREALAGARRSTGPRDVPPGFLPRPLPMPRAAPDDTVALDDLVRFLEHPVRGFVRQRLGVSLLSEDDPVRDALPVDLDALDRWSVGDRLLRSRLQGAGADEAEQAEWRRGSLPPGALGARLLQELRRPLDDLVAAAAPVLGGEPRPLDVAVPVGDGSRVVGPVEVRTRPGAGSVVRVTYSRVAAKHLLRAWATLLAVTAGAPELVWRAVVVGRGERGTTVRATLGPLDPDAAAVDLARLVELRRTGLCAPLPMSAKTSAAYARARWAGMSADNALEKARREWDGSEVPGRAGPAGGVPGERSDDAHALVWGDAPAFGVLLTEPGRPGGEPTRFGDLARQLWSPLLGAETREVA